MPFFFFKFNIDCYFLFYLTQNWSFMRQLCNRGPILKKMHEFQCEDVELASAKRARILLSSYNRDTIIKISAAIVNVFNWVGTESKDSKLSRERERGVIYLVFYTFSNICNVFELLILQFTDVFNLCFCRPKVLCQRWIITWTQGWS